jgi:hypothetical protein
LQNHATPAMLTRLTRVSKRSLMIAGAALFLGGATPAVIAAPGMGAVVSYSQAQNVDWLSTDQAQSLDVGIDVLVPSWVPAPFDAVAPSISSAGGYYEIYWMVPGLPPTFLQITGIAGGGLPAGSPADLNRQLEINDSVQGWPAIHDLGIPAGSDTPIYDQVWWIANGVLYSVSSNNMSGSDSLSLANALVSLEIPAAPVEEPTVPVVEEPVPTMPAEAPSEAGPVLEDPPVTVEVPTQAPVVEQPATDDNVVVPETDVPVDAPAPTEATAPTEVPASTTPSESLDGVGGTTGPIGNVPSDGTGGPRPPIFGGDGTGGVQDIALPRESRSR